MARVTTDNQHYANIAAAIRGKTGGTATYKPSEMAAAIGGITTGGGDDLNFEVVGGTTQPENPEENTIWVNTGEEITKWRISVGEPDNPADGDVWFKLSVSENNTIEALTENSLIFAITSAQQYKTNGWENVDAQIYRDGGWSSALSGLVIYDGIWRETTGFETDNISKI